MVVALVGKQHVVRLCELGDPVGQGIELHDSVGHVELWRQLGVTFIPVPCEASEADFHLSVTQSTIAAALAVRTA